MNNGTTKQWPWLLATALAVLAATTLQQTSFAKSGIEPGMCKQWQTAAMPPIIDINGELPEVGKPRIDTAPEGWEPFALGYGGQVIYKRCVK